MLYSSGVTTPQNSNFFKGGSSFMLTHDNVAALLLTLKKGGMVVVLFAIRLWGNSPMELLPDSYRGHKIHLLLW